MAQFEAFQGSLQAQAHIWNHLFSFINTMSLKCAIELRIPEAIHKHGGQPVTLPQLVSALGIPPSKMGYLGRLMRLLTLSGFFTMQTATDDREAVYLLTNYSELLLWDNPHSVSPLLRVMLDPVFMTPWRSLSAWFRTDGSPTPCHHQHGMDLWELISQSSEMNDMLNAGMASDSHLLMDVVIREHGDVFRGLKSLVDVGGGNGATAMALAVAFPQLKCTVLDLPHVVASTPKGTVVEFVAGDMFEYVPPADAVLMKWVLHDWSDEQCVKLLKLCKEAIAPKEDGGKVIIIEMVVREDLHEDELRETQYFFDLQMMVHTDGGKQRGEKGWAKLFQDAGFSGYNITPGLGLRAIIEAYP